MRRSSLHCTLLVALALAWVPTIARAGGARPGARETPAQQRANKARKDRARYGADASIERLSIGVAGGGGLKAIRVDRGGLLRERVRTVTAEPGGGVRINVVQGEQGRVIQSSATSIVRKSGARITAKEVVKLNRKTGRHRVSRGSSYKTGDAEAWSVGKSEVR
jgi:hypothetical protein